MDDNVKGDNFAAGMPKGIFNSIVGMIAGAGGVGSKDEQIALLLELAREEQAALHPGEGRTGMLDAVSKFTALEQGVQALSAANPAKPAEVTAAITTLTLAIRAIGKMWLVGPVSADFFGSD